MLKSTEVLKKSGTFYVATLENNQPRVRPFGAVGEIDGSTYICLNNQKKVYQQLIANPKIEISGMFEGKWFRLWGKAVRDDRVEARTQMIEQNPGLANMYKPDDGLYEVFRLEDAHGAVESFTDPKEEF
ncbi:MAG: pyridoxamine 5'-phosphate oxidase family protein [Oscillospiraceae bacterium]|jgi:uncharacterized pyridoxamine 5'-phosphate oxidase family protein|nr:pyridoxamine 5'-phosphate oxidase family protein [Oscillospiraceae bacterium]